MVSVLTYVRTYVQNKTKQTDQRLNLFWSSCFGWCLGVDHCTTQVLYENSFLTIFTLSKVFIKFAYVVPEDKAGITKYIEVTVDSYRSGDILDGTMKFLGQSEQMLLVAFLDKSFLFGHEEIQIHSSFNQRHTILLAGIYHLYIDILSEEDEYF